MRPSYAGSPWTPDEGPPGHRTAPAGIPPGPCRSVVDARLRVDAEPGEERLVVGLVEAVDRRRARAVRCSGRTSVTADDEPFERRGVERRAAGVAEAGAAASAALSEIRPCSVSGGVLVRSGSASARTSSRVSPPKSVLPGDLLEAVADGLERRAASAVRGVPVEPVQRRELAVLSASSTRGVRARRRRRRGGRRRQVVVAADAASRSPRCHSLARVERVAPRGVAGRVLVG